MASSNLDFKDVQLSSLGGRSPTKCSTTGSPNSSPTEEEEEEEEEEVPFQSQADNLSFAWVERPCPRDVETACCHVQN